MADTVGDIVTRIQGWCIDSDLEDAELWSLMDEVIDDVMRKSDPWFSFNYAQTARTAANHMNDNDYIPPAYEDGVLAVDADIVSGATVPDNSEYLRALSPPTGLRKPIKVYYGDLADNVELEYVGYEEFEDRYPHNTEGGGVNAPAHWSNYGGAILVGPAPPLATTLSIFGTYRPTRISANADVNPFVEECADLLRYGAMEKLILYNFEEDSGRLNTISRFYRRARTGLVSEGKYRTHRAHRAKSRRAGTRRT